MSSGYSCYDPVVRFSPNGLYVYYEYMNVDPTGLLSDIYVTTCDGFQPSIGCKAPTVPFPNNGDFMDKNWLDVAKFDASAPNMVYVTATDFRSDGYCAIAFNSSSDYGATWQSTVGDWISVGNPMCDPLQGGSRPIGGLGGEVLACWYNSETDGPQKGVFDIRCAENTNYGVNGS